MTIDDATLQRLIDKGRQHGNRLGIEQLGQDMPVETMTPEEVAVVVERLEAAGIDVELTDERLKRPRGGGDYRRGAGVVGIATPAAPAVSAPDARPSEHGWADEGLGHAHGTHHGSRRAPTWDRGGVDMLPVVSVIVVALVLIIALGG
ncbi:RNA polymerase sigma factor region1.1 domain-containing protein [Azospirillum aestuarii]|uniref:RNA polymerase sigma factor region1.1 domain-containing protein n=1 Tax=Azospirillum aestuarii TaxID=2802052 RepID=UPI0040551E2B